MIDNHGSLLTAGSMAASLNSTALPLNFAMGFSIQATISSSSSPVGTIKLQASNKALPGASIASTDWVDITTPTTTVQAITGDGTVFYDISDVNFKWVRCVWTRTSGSGVLDVIYNLKPIVRWIV